MLDYWERKAQFFARKTQLQQQVTDQTQQVRLASLIEESIVDGPGMRFVIFTQGCPHRCLGCHNPQTHLEVGGTMFSVEKILALYEEHLGCRGISLSGGEPFAQAGPVAKIAAAIHQRDGDVITYTGYRLEHLTEMAKDDQEILALLDETDLLIDGLFIQEQRCLDQPFVGSLNQRLIALSQKGNELLDDIPVIQTGSKIKRIYFK